MLNYKKFRRMIQDRFGEYILDDGDVMRVYEVFKNYVALIEKRNGDNITDNQVKAVLDTVEFSVRNVLNILSGDW